MRLNRIIIGFIIILILFSGFIVLQLNKKPQGPQVVIDKQTFSVEIATTSAQQQLGLSGRESLPKDHGMLFIFPSAQNYPFWMKDMKIPLDMIFINNNKIVTIFQNVPTPKTSGTANLPVYAPTAPANQVLEINAGLAKTYNFKKGDTVTTTLK